MGSLERRLTHLEAKVGAGEPCEECGIVPGSSDAEKYGHGFEVEWAHETGRPVEGEYCPECGEQQVFVVRWPEHLPDGPPLFGARRRRKGC